MKECHVGGQAVVDGVMMRGENGKATAVRNQKGYIEVDFEKYVVAEKKLVDKIPIIRGVLSLGNSLESGLESFNYSLGVVIGEKDGLEAALKEYFGHRAENLTKKVTLSFSVILSILIFIVIPSAITALFRYFNFHNSILTLIEGIVTLLILISYLMIIKENDIVKNLFKYHGAEHKTINCYEREEDLNIENVKTSSRLHKRCGTNFLFTVIFVNTILSLFIGWRYLGLRLILKLFILPIIVGITYEIIKWLGCSNGILATIVSYPGVRLQLLTTEEPTDEEIEVAIMALKVSEGLEVEKTIYDILNEATNILRKNDIDTCRLDAQLLLGYVLNKDKLWLITNNDFRPSKEEGKEFFNLIEKRAKKMPIKYILGKAEFMALDFFVKEGVLIPRPDTEILVEEVLSNIEDRENLNICDLCCGSGAIGLSIGKYRENTKVDLVDIDDIPKEVTTKNIKLLQLEERATFIQSDLFKELKGKQYDIIVSNPPYIKDEIIETLMEDVKNYEPHLALAGGTDGLAFYRKIIEESKTYLKGKAILAFEIGHDQGEEVKDLMESDGFKDVKVIKDLAGLHRVVIGKVTID